MRKLNRNLLRQFKITSEEGETIPFWEYFNRSGLFEIVKRGIILDGHDKGCTVEWVALETPGYASICITPLHPWRRRIFERIPHEILEDEVAFFGGPVQWFPPEDE